MIGVVTRQISIRWLNTESAQHAHNLATMKSRVVDRMQNNLPPRNPEDPTVRQHRRDLLRQFDIGRRLKPFTIASPDLRPRLHQEFKRMLWSRSPRKTSGAALNQSTQPYPLSIVNVPKRTQNTRMGRAETTSKLFGVKPRADIQHSSRTPCGIPHVSEEKLLQLRHKRIIKKPRGPRAEASGKIKTWS
jgi:hypothetical protein